MQLSDHNMSIFIEAFFSLCIFTHTQKRKKDKGIWGGIIWWCQKNCFCVQEQQVQGFRFYTQGPYEKKNMATRFCINTAAPFFSLCCMFVVKVVVQPCYWFNSVLSMSEFTILHTRSTLKWSLLWSFCSTVVHVGPNLRAIVSWDSWLDYSRFKMNLFKN